MMPSPTNGKKRFATTSRRRIRRRLDDEGRPVNSTVEIEPPVLPDPTEQEKQIRNVIQKSFEIGDDAAKAVARFEAEVTFPRYRENDLSEEEFGTEEFSGICERLSQLKMVKELLPLFGLGDYEKEILYLLIDKAFGRTKSFSNEGFPSKVFKGDDEALLDYQAKTSEKETIVGVRRGGRIS